MFRKILLAVDVNDRAGASRTAEAAVRLARSEEAELHVVNVVPEPGMAMVSAYLGPQHEAKLLAESKAALETWAAQALPGELQAELHVAQGSIYDQIIRTAAAIGADVIVVGSHRPELKDYLIGPNAARVARHAPQSVFVIR